jgi:predicted kinase
MTGGGHRALHPRLIVVSGRGCSGKTTLAHQLASVVGCPTICRDEIKEGMVHACGPDFEVTPGDPLTVLTYPLFFNVIRLLLEGGATVVAEAAFQHANWEQGLTPLSALADLRVLRCSATDEERLRRGRRRHLEVSTRSAHDDKSWIFNDGPRPFDAIHIDAPTLDVNTTHGYTPPLDEIAAFVNARDEKRKT